jgi:RNA polymerase sigma-70 factor (ECF subfamily)
MSVLTVTAFISAENCGTNGNLDLRSEEQLIAAAKNGQRAAFGELCERHTRKILLVTQRITGNREDAEDAVQDSVLSAFVHLNDFDGRSRFATWLTRIAINSALMKLRKRRGKREVPMDEHDPAADPRPHFEIPDSAPNPEETYLQREQKELVGAAIAALRPRVRKVVEFQTFHEYSIKETAQALGISHMAAKTRMFHARVALRRMSLLKRVARTHCANAG